MVQCEFFSDTFLTVFLILKNIFKVKLNFLIDFI